MSVNEFLATVRDALGLDNVGIVAGGFAGGLLRALSHRQWRWREIIISPTCGLLAAINLTPVVLHIAGEIARILHWEMPDAVLSERAIAFLLGASAMRLCDDVLAWIFRRLNPTE